MGERAAPGQERGVPRLLAARSPALYASRHRVRSARHPASNAHRPLRGRARDRPRWDGHRLPGRGREASPFRGDQGAPRRARRGPGSRALPPGDRDRRAAAASPHPAAVRFRFGRRSPVLRMPFVEGESLRDRLTREKQLPLEDALRIATEVAGALAYAHSHGIVHRDIKPENIMLSAGSAVVADFGIARAVSAAGAGEHLTQTGTIIGTPAYMSPEQATGRADVDGRSDEYSLACVVYEMLVGEPPFTGPTAQAVIARHSLDLVSPPSIVRASIPDAVEAAILRALSKVPVDRYSTTALFAEALNAPSAATGAVRRATLERGLARPQSKWWRVVPVAAAVAVVGGYLVVRSLGPARVASVGGPDPRHLAVLYFADDTKDHTLSYLADGLTEALIEELRQVPSLTVISRNGVAPYRDPGIPADSVARALKVGTIVRGDVEMAGGGRGFRVSV